MRTYTTIARPLAVLGFTALAAGGCSDTTTPVAPVVPTAPSLAKGGPNMPPTNGRIYFTSSFAGNYDVYSMKPDGTDRRRLTLTTDGEAFVNVSPDGKKLIVGSYRATAGSELLTINVDGTNRRVLVSSDAAVMFGYPAFSPDGRNIAYVSNLENAQNVYSVWTVSASGGKATRLTPSTESAAFPSWSPDARRIVYSSGPAGTLGEDLYIMNADGSAPQLLHDCAGSCLTPVWSPDGSRIIYIAAENGVLALRACSLLTSIPQCGIPVAHSGYPSSVALSPDGSQLVYAAFDQNDLDVHRVMTSNVNGSGQTVLTANLSSIGELAWGR